MKKFYMLESERNEEEKRTGHASYASIIKKYCDNNIILCNNIVNIDTSIFDNILVGNIYDEESEEYTEIYQYFIIDLSEWQIKSLQELTQNNNDVIIAYSEVLENYILMVDHLGTSWDYVDTSILLSENIEECI